MAVPNFRGKDDYASVYTANDFVESLRKDGWDPGSIPHGVIFTYGGFEMLCGAQADQYSMNPMLGPGPGRFFTATPPMGTSASVAWVSACRRSRHNWKC